MLGHVPTTRRIESDVTHVLTGAEPAPGPKEPARLTNYSGRLLPKTASSALVMHQQGMTVSAIAQRTGLHQSTVAKYMVNRFHATFLTDVDQATIAEVEAGDAIAGVCAIPRPKPPQPG
jgi:DNA-binding NarL/FixJ family response regulator